MSRLLPLLATLALAACGGADDNPAGDASQIDDRPGVSGSSTGDEQSEAGGAPAQAGALPGRLEVGGEVVLPDRPQLLADLVGQEAQGERLSVLSEIEGGFFVGTGPADRVLVLGELPEGAERVDLRGTVQAAPESFGQLGLEDADAESVKQRGALLEASDVQPVAR
jgi:hypothetical protein